MENTKQSWPIEETNLETQKITLPNEEKILAPKEEKSWKEILFPKEGEKTSGKELLEKIMKKNGALKIGLTCFIIFLVVIWFNRGLSGIINTLFLSILLLPLFAISAKFFTHSKMPTNGDKTIIGNRNTTPYKKNNLFNIKDSSKIFKTAIISIIIPSLLLLIVGAKDNGWWFGGIITALLALFLLPIFTFAGILFIHDRLAIKKNILAFIYYPALFVLAYAIFFFMVIVLEQSWALESVRWGTGISVSSLLSAGATTAIITLGTIKLREWFYSDPERQVSSWWFLRERNLSHWAFVFSIILISLAFLAIAACLYVYIRYDINLLSKESRNWY